MAERFDLLLRGGHVLDAPAGIDHVADIGIAGGSIIALERSLPLEKADDVFDASGCLVIPGLIDLHTHVYWGAAPLSIDPEPIAAIMGVTTWVDAGTAGPGTIAAFIRHVVERAEIRIVPFLNVSFVGLAAVRPNSYTPTGEINQAWLIDTEACVEVARRYPGVIRGVKVRASFDVFGGNGVAALQAARLVADTLDLPLMLHISIAPPTIEHVLPYLRAGDILTHCHTPFLSGMLDRDGRIRPEVWWARERGVLFDVGHGAGSFSFEVAEAALAQGFPPDCISTDLSSVSIDGPAIDMATTMIKFVALGMDLSDVITRVTAEPARALRMGGKIGTLTPGACADIAVLSRIEAPKIVGDVRGGMRTAPYQLQVEATFRAGRRLVPPSATSDYGSASALAGNTSRLHKWPNREENSHA